jgi:D-alanine-D-alanine ligase
MDIHVSHSNLPVLLLYNLDRNWPVEEIQESVEAMEILCAGLQQEGYSVTPVCLEDADLPGCLSGFHPNNYLVFNWCEELPGVPRSAAAVARTLEALGFTFTGTGSQALTFSQDKRLVKQRLRQDGIPTPAWKIYAPPEKNGWKRFPAIVKPAFEHCSFGVTREAVVQSGEELNRRIAYVFDVFSQPALVEEFIDGREFHVTAIGNGALHVLPPAEMDFSAFEDVHDRLCTYESKFDPESVPYNAIKLHLPGPLTEGELLELERVATAAYRAADCRDYARLDIRLRDGVFYVLDINPNADISPDTSLAMAAELVGLSYGALASLLVDLASQRHPVFGALQQEVTAG